MKRIREQKKEIFLLFRELPAWVFTLFVSSSIVMNLLANKSILLPVDWLALDCGIVVSWVSFFMMDLITKRFGARAAIIVSIATLLINLFWDLIFALGAGISGMWGEASSMVQSQLINRVLDNTFSGSWFVIFGSCVAFILSSLVNSLANEMIGNRTRLTGIREYLIRSCCSTMLGQFVDNLTFSLIVSYHLFGWSLLQCVTCAFTGAVVELFLEFLFSHLGYRITERWEKDQVGAEYVRLYHAR